MKARLILVFLSLIICLSAVACNPLDKNAETTPDSVASSFESTPNTPEETPDPETPAEEFKLEENEDGTLTIKKYLGDDKRVIIPETIDGKTVTLIGTAAFSYKINLEYVKMPDTITVIHQRAFINCVNLKTAVLSQNLNRISHSVFERCTALADIVLPESLVFMESDVFRGCTSLKHIRVPANAFSRKGSGDGAFADSGLETVELPEGIERIPDGVFLGTKLKSVTLPNSVKKIENGAFALCADLESITLNNGLEVIEKSAFNSSSIEEIIIPATVTEILDSSFKDCEKLAKVKFEGNAPSIYIDSENPSGIEYSICYHEGAEGFTSGEWCGFKTEIW